MILNITADGQTITRDAGALITNAEMVLEKHPAGRPWNLDDLNRPISQAAQIGVETASIGARTASVYAMQLHALISVGEPFTLPPQR